MQLDTGETANFAGFELTFDNSFSRQEPRRFVSGATITVERDGSVISVLEPRLNNYPNNTQTVATPAVDTMFRGDLYLSLRSIDAERVVLEVFWFPFIWLIWVGGFLAAAAGVWAYVARKPERTDIRVEEAGRV
jgi:cytochrome c-type biogenesis protein CcmF